MIPLGHRTYLDAKAKGESSMFEKAGRPKTIKGHARRDPDGMVKAKLPEPQWPFCKSTRLDTMVKIQTSQVIISQGSGLIRGQGLDLPTNTLPRDKVGITNLKATNRAPTTVLNVIPARNAGSPKGGDPHGDGAPIVV